MDKNDLMLNAINDVQDSLRSMDNKVTFLLGVVGILISAIVGIKDCIDTVYKSLQLNSFLCIFFQLTTLIGFSSVILLFTYAIKCMLPKYNKHKKKYEVWYLNSQTGYEEYIQNVNELTDANVTDVLVDELFIVNQINIIKTKEVEKAYKCFAFFCITLVIVICYILFYFL